MSATFTAIVHDGVVYWRLDATKAPGLTELSVVDGIPTRNPELSECIAGFVRVVSGGGRVGGHVSAYPCTEQECSPLQAFHRSLVIFPFPPFSPPAQ